MRRTGAARAARSRRGPLSSQGTAPAIQEVASFPSGDLARPGERRCDNSSPRPTTTPSRRSWRSRCMTLLLLAGSTTALSHARLPSRGRGSTATALGATSPPAPLLARAPPPRGSPPPPRPPPWPAYCAGGGETSGRRRRPSSVCGEGRRSSCALPRPTFGEVGISWILAMPDGRRRTLTSPTVSRTWSRATPWAAERWPPPPRPTKRRRTRPRAPCCRGRRPWRRRPSWCRPAARTGEGTTRTAPSRGSGARTTRWASTGARGASSSRGTGRGRSSRAPRPPRRRCGRGRARTAAPSSSSRRRRRGGPCPS